MGRGNKVVVVAFWSVFLVSACCLVCTLVASQKIKLTSSRLLKNEVRGEDAHKIRATYIAIVTTTAIFVSNLFQLFLGGKKGQLQTLSLILAAAFTSEISPPNLLGCFVLLTLKLRAIGDSVSRTTAVPATFNAANVQVCFFFGSERREERGDTLLRLYQQVLKIQQHSLPDHLVYESGCDARLASTA